MDGVWTRREDLQQSGFFTQVIPLLQTFQEHPNSGTKTKLCVLRRPHSNCPLTGPGTSVLPTPQPQPRWPALLVNRLQMDLENVSRS